MIPKRMGRDCELSTTGLDADGRPVDPADVAQQVLRQIGPVFERRGGAAWTHSRRFHAYSMDCLRHWTSNGQCYYSDMSHVECCTATCLDPLVFSAQCLSLLAVAEDARRRAEDESDGERYSLSAANADALDPSISFGTHLSISIESALWEDLFVDLRRPGILGTVASGLAAAVPFFGAGYLLPLEDGTCVYSLSARAHHLTKMSTLSTTEAFRRGLLNSRREPHGDGQDRLHLIGFDSCTLSSALLSSFLGCLLAAVEEGWCGPMLYDPVRALRGWSWGLDLNTGRLPATATLIDGRRLTLPEFLRELTATLLRMCESGFIPGHIAPRATGLLPRVIELTHYAEEGSIGRCARHLTWAAKLLCLLDLCQRQGAVLGDAATRLADHDFTNTNPRGGGLWRLWEQGAVDPLVNRDDVAACREDGPADSRDFARGRLVRRFADQIASVDWDYVELRRSDDPWSSRTRIDLSALDSFPREACERLFETATGVEHLERLLRERLGRPGRSSDPVEELTGRLALVAPAEEA
ncbi:MAG TPA: proteasome accessory factor PafA2 family protein [Planctomycetaceae bacterium]|nr:proteasome accessory factor PafA2 family protein [Planctomycetaceae bacterium]